MDIYKENGDNGTTSLVHSKNVSKSDDRIVCIGDIDELDGHIHLIEELLDDDDVICFLEKVRDNIAQISSGISDTYNRDFKISSDTIKELDAETERLKAFIADNAQTSDSAGTAKIKIAHAVCRRAERSLALVGVKFGADVAAKKYFNRLSKYLEQLSIWAELTQKFDRPQTASAVQTSVMTNESVINEVLKRIGAKDRLTLSDAKWLIDEIEKEACRRNMNDAIAICNAEGNIIAVHVMDGSYLVSFDAAVKKAYTAASVRMSTLELSKLAQPGEMFYGVDKLADGKMTIIGGGVPLTLAGRVVGAIGVSGGTAVDDDALAAYAAALLEKNYNA